MAVTPNIGKLIDSELLKVFKEQQELKFNAKLDEKEALGTAAGLVGKLDTLTTEAKDTVVAALNEVDANADAAQTAADKAQTAADKAQEGVDANKAAIETLNGAASVDGSVDKKVKDASDAINATIGNTTDLATDEKGIIVGAINEVKEAANTLNVASKVTLDADDVARVYKLYQGGSDAANLIGTINIGKDLVVKSGEVKEVETKGTCLVLTLTSDDVVEIPVSSLIDIYTAGAGAKEVQVAIDSTTKIVTATLVDDGIATAKIADLAVTKAKLAQAVQDSLDKADSAVQEIKEGTGVGTIAVDGADVTVHGVADIKATADAAKTTVDKLDGTAEVEGSVKAQIAASETAVKAAVKVDTDALGERAKALEDWKATVGLATEADILAMFA